MPARETESRETTRLRLAINKALGRIVYTGPGSLHWRVMAQSRFLDCPRDVEVTLTIRWTARAEERVSNLCQVYSFRLANIDRVHLDELLRLQICDMVIGAVNESTTFRADLVAIDANGRAETA